MLSLAKLHHAQSDFQRARELLDRIQPDRLTPEQRAQLARLFAQQGLTARAAALLESATVPTTNPADKLLLADLYRYRNQPEKAEQLFKELLKNPDLPTIIAAAGFYAANHRQSDADNALALLDSLKLEPGLRERALAEHHALYGATEKALEYARAATAAAPANPDAWRSLITLSLRSGLVPDALAAAAQAAKNIPSQTLFPSFVAQSDDIKTLASNPSFLPLVAAVFQTPDPAPVLEVIRAVADAVRTPQPPAALIAKLRPLADRSPSLVPLQVLLMHTCAAADRLEDAATLARRTLAAAPASPDAADAAIRILAAAKDLPGALNAASRYRELTLNNPLKADALLAELHLRSGDLPAAQKQIAPYLPLAQANPDPYISILIIQARIHLAQREPAKAADLLAPHLARSPAFRRVWLELSLALTTDQPDLAASWLQRISASMSNAAPDEFIALATAWQALAQLSADPKYIDQARALLTDLATRAEKPAPVYFSLGLLHANQRKFPEAEQFYRRALQLDPTMSTAQNNLAMVLYELNSNLDEAAALASKAVQAAPSAAPYHDTLGLILAKQGHTAAAITTLKKAIDLDKFNPEWKLTLATLYHQTAQYPEAARLLAEIDALTRDSKNLPPDFRSRLTQLRMKLDAKLPR
jgi:tetratricopeptide (TPR) repeat protein